MPLITIIIAIILSSITIAILYNKDLLSKRFNFLDNSIGSNRKIHKNKISNIGGCACLIPILIALLITGFIPNEYIFSKKYILIAIITSISFFFLGRIDDLKDLTPNRKFLTFCFLFLFFYPLEPNLIVHQINFKYLNINLILNNYSIFFTLFCMFVFFNTSNFIDGVNGLYASTMLFWLLFLIFKIKTFPLIILTIILCLIFFVFYNLNNKVFMGNSGNAFITCLIGSLYIYLYNKTENIFCDEIFIVFLIPGIDALRVSIERIWSGKSPFEGDKNHLHHFIFKKFNQKYTWIVSLFLNVSPLLILVISNNFWISICLSMVLYTFTYYFFKKI